MSESTRENVIHGSDPEIVKLLAAFGVPEPETCKRVIFDFAADDFGKMYIERYPLLAKLDTKKIVDLDLKLRIVEVEEAKVTDEG